MTRNMAHALANVGGQQVYVALHTKVAPSDEEWREWTTLLEKHGKAAEWDLAKTPNLVVTDGGAPSTAQRTVVNVLIAQAKTMPAVALVTDSTMVRAIARAFTIFNPRFRVFAPSQIREAAVHAGLASADVPELISALVRLEGDVLGAGAVSTLGELVRGGGR